ncbi:MAG: hypothetical protein UY28_C0004G0064 [Candidatus Amesbacteria bacterium GW2011_GWB1_48_13]|uniref:Uncharacterized protein n=1 Tax=Candidatus Amesbacteria bacterium GW2011_GWB1_48_13 TaxID=1618362 RepID=A0A0G1UW92_9BACT|nr:MAG: hypothetical protein UY28_C0004G0064 [Candidatus Amesbacteria bacterium GW2011_GWB1_48_13]
MDEEILRQKLVVGRKLVADLCDRANRGAVEALITAFRNNTHLASLPEIINDPDGYVFTEVMLKAATGGKAIEALGDVPSEINRRDAMIYTIGLYVGVYLSELGKAKIILRTGGTDG